MSEQDRGAAGSAGPGPGHQDAGPAGGSDGPQFTVHRLRRGYSTQEVDAFLDGLAASIGQGDDVPDIAGVTFSPVYGGYDEREVDAFLEDLRHQLGRA